MAVRVVAPGLDIDTVDRLTRSLQMEIREIGVAKVTPSTAAAPPDGAKSAEAIAVGALLVSLAPTVVESLMRVVESWLSRQRPGIEAEIDDNRIKGTVTREQQTEIVQAFLRRVGERP